MTTPAHKPPSSRSEGFHWEAKHTTLAVDRVPVWRKAAYGAGGLSDFFYLNVVGALLIPIYTVALKMNPLLVAVAMALPKLVGAITDPLVGAFSDNARTRWGRRRPFILVGAILGALLLPLVWTPLVHTQTAMFLHLAVVLSLSAATYSVFAVPYGALGYELTTDYDERTRVLAWRAYIGTIGTFSGSWFYWFCLRPGFGNEVVGVRWLSGIGALFIIGGALATVAACRENTRHVLQQPKISLRDALALTLKNRPFLLLQAAVLMIAVGMGCEGLIGNYVHIFYTCQGNKGAASLISGLGGTLTVFSSFAAVPMGLLLSTHLGKRRCSLVGLLIGLVGVVILPVTLVYEHPYRIIISWIIITLGMSCASLMFGSMTADICDEDELATGLRREGAYVAVASFFGKVVSVLTLLLAGWLPRWAGYLNTDVSPSMGQLGRMRTMLIVIQMMALLAALAVIWFYPITRAKSAETRRLLDARRLVC